MIPNVADYDAKYYGLLDYPKIKPILLEGNPLEWEHFRFFLVLVPGDAGDLSAQ